MHASLRRRLASPVLTAALAVGLVVTSAGWVSAAHQDGSPPECYSVGGDSRLTFHLVHGGETSRVTFSVAESEEEVTASLSQDVGSGFHTAVGLPSTVTYQLGEALGDRPVVDPAGRPIRRC